MFLTPQSLTAPVTARDYRARMWTAEGAGALDELPDVEDAWLAGISADDWSAYLKIAEFARDLYCGHPAAIPLLDISLRGESENARVRAAAALTALDPLTPVSETQMRAHLRGERSAAQLRGGEVAGYITVPDAQPLAGRETRSGSRFYLESAVEFLAETDPAEDFVVSELVPAGRTILLHGEPRTRKSWAAAELALAAATGTPAFGLARFSVSTPVPVLYASQEDGRRDVRARLRRLLAGRGITAGPEALFLAVHAGIDLESPEWQETLIRDVIDRAIGLVILDPIRRFSPNVDKGPAEVRGVSGFLRRLTVETGAAMAVIHHDVKPGREEDTRRRGHKASGGDWFAASDCPIHVESAGQNRTLVVPEDFKHGSDPASFSFRIEEDEAKTWARVVAEDVAAADVGSVALHERILEHLRHNPGSPGNAVARGVRGSKGTILEALRTLEAAGKLDSVNEKRKTAWFIKGEA